ncbi:MAG: hypothetical protein RIS94_2305 [Pseudomonadota bacterium]
MKASRPGRLHHLHRMSDPQIGDRQMLGTTASHVARLVAQGFAASEAPSVSLSVGNAAPDKEVPELNNNRGNNRRRGRGNNRPQGGGQQLNRIDSRARGNAPQLLEKYRKLAQDAHLNGDRVQAEYYLQFADHYFRVIADTRVRQEEQRTRQNGGVAGDRWQDQDTEDEGDFSVEGDFPAFDRPPARREEREPRENREPRAPRENRRRFEPQVATEEALPGEGVRADEGEPVIDAGDNPFVPAPRTVRGGLRPRGERRQQRDAEPAPVALDPSSLPPAIGARAEQAEEAYAGSAEDAAPAPKKRGRPRKTPAPEAAE